jgi:hypothetical protein
VPGAPDLDLGDSHRDEGGGLARYCSSMISLAVAAGLIVAGIGLATLGDRLLRRQAVASG